MTVPTIHPREVVQRRESGRPVDIIDVRTPIEHLEIHADGVRLIPLDSLDPGAVIQARNGSSDEPLYLICKSGRRSAMACEKFIRAGFTNVFSIDGGTDAWAAAGLPVIRGRKVVSLERQVRIVAGIIVLISVVLGFTIHPWFFALGGLVGAGLTFAGITDCCAMGMLLARMPWNRRVNARPECAS